MGKLLQGRVAVVTGGGNGIGRAEAIALANHGAKVLVNDLGTSYDGWGRSRKPANAVVEEIRSSGNAAIADYHNVATEKGAESIIKAAIDHFGRIDVLVNNAGIVRDPRNIYDYATRDWEHILRTHLYGTFYCTRRACFYMKEQRYGRIINTSSHVGLGWKGFSAYGAAKEGIIGFTRTVAREMAEYGVTCNAIRPIAAWRGSREITPEMAINRPEDVASLVVFLACEQADAISGCIFEVWHGHVSIFTEPPPVQQVLKKQGRWTVDELAEIIPQTLTRGRSRESFTDVLRLR